METPIPPPPQGELVVCPNCNAAYQVPLGVLKRQRVKLRCTGCKDVFSPPSEFQANPVLTDRQNPDRGTLDVRSGEHTDKVKGNADWEDTGLQKLPASATASAPIPPEDHASSTGFLGDTEDVDMNALAQASAADMDLELGDVGAGAGGELGDLELGDVGAGAGGELGDLELGDVGAGAGGELGGIELGDVGAGEGGELGGIELGDVGAVGAGAGGELGDLELGDVGAVGAGAGGELGDLELGDVGAGEGGELGDLELGDVGAGEGGELGDLELGDVGAGAGGELGDIELGDVGAGAGGELGDLELGDVGAGAGGELGDIELGDVGAVGAGAGGELGDIELGDEATLRPIFDAVAMDGVTDSEDILQAPLDEVLEEDSVAVGLGEGEDIRLTEPFVAMGASPPTPKKSPVAPVQADKKSFWQRLLQRIKRYTPAKKSFWQRLLQRIKRDTPALQRRISHETSPRKPSFWRRLLGKKAQQPALAATSSIPASAGVPTKAMPVLNNLSSLPTQMANNPSFDEVSVDLGDTGTDQVSVDLGDGSSDSSGEQAYKEATQIGEAAAAAAEISDEERFGLFLKPGEKVESEKIQKKDIPPAAYVPRQGIQKIGKWGGLGLATAALIGGVGWGAWWGYEHRQQLQSTIGHIEKTILPSHRLVLEGVLQGRYVTNIHKKVRLFVVQGTLKNRFSSQNPLRWVRVKGLAYSNAARKKPLVVSYSYVGKMLSNRQLRRWKVKNILAFYRKQKLLSKDEIGQNIPFQIVFLSSKTPVQTAVAQIFAYRLKGKKTVHIQKNASQKTKTK